MLTGSDSDNHSMADQSRSEDEQSDRKKLFKTISAQIFKSGSRNLTLHDSISTAKLKAIAAILEIPD